MDFPESHQPYQPPREEPASIPPVVQESPFAEPAVAKVWTAPPVWPSIVACVGAIIAAAVAQVFVMVVAYLVLHDGQPPRSSQELSGWLKDLASTPTGVAVLVAPGQLVFVSVALFAGAFSRQPLASRLGLRRGTYPVWTWLLFGLGTPAVGLTSSLLLSAVVERPSEQLQALEQMFIANRGAAAISLLVIVAVLPGICEELLFRGLVLNRLLLRYSAPVAITLSACLFAAAHIDPIHALAVVPLGVWLGVLLWRTESVWPAVLGHAANNGIAILATQWSADGQELHAPLAAAVLALVFLAFLISLVLLLRKRGESQIMAVEATLDGPA